MTALDTFRGIESFNISNITGDPSACGIPDVYGNIAYFNKLCVLGSPVLTGAVPTLQSIGVGGYTLNQPFQAGSWVTIFFAGAQNGLTVPASQTQFATSWLIWSTGTLQDTSGNPNTVYVRLQNPQGTQNLAETIQTIPANGYSDFSLTLAVTSSSVASYLLQLQIKSTGAGNVMGNQFISGDYSPLAPNIFGIQTG